MAEAKAWTILGLIGSIYTILAGIVIMALGVAAANQLQQLIMLMYVPALQPYYNYILTWISMISPNLATWSLGPLAPIFGFQGAGALSGAGIAILILGILNIIGAGLLWTGNKWGAALWILFGLILTFVAFNFGGLLCLIAGIVLWYEL
nr:hypothetical protein [Candidatus Freyarchaeota archaeon]